MGRVDCIWEYDSKLASFVCIKVGTSSQSLTLMKNAEVLGCDLLSVLSTCGLFNELHT